LHTCKPSRGLPNTTNQLNILSQWSPNARGILARPWNDVDKGASIRAKHDAALERLVSRENVVDKAIVDAVEELAKARKLPMAVIAMAWCLSKEGVNPIVGLSSKARIDEAVLAVKVKLTEAEIAQLESAYQPKAVTGY
jgi:aryl-alcohol dehydrogenase-like predicted oxidoreductase